MPAPSITARQKAVFEHNAARDDDASPSAIHLSRLSGMAPADIDTLCDFTRSEALLMVIRCAKRPARYSHGKVAAKPARLKGVSSDPNTGLVQDALGRSFVSDNDLMSVARFLGDGYEKIVFSSPPDGSTKALPPKAALLLRKINPRLKARFQHGAQDDWHAPDHPNVQLATTTGPGGKPIDRFIAFNIGNPLFFANPHALKAFYDSKAVRIDWPYDAKGHHRSYRGPGAMGAESGRPATNGG